MKIEINKLNPHPKNRYIYGYDDNLDELIEKIRTSQWIKPILINSQNTIISGHRRVESCKKLGITEVEYELVVDDPVIQLELLVAENFYRVKTTTQLMKEAEIYEEIEKHKAYQRKIEIGKLNLGQSSDEVNWSQLGEKGRTTEKVSNMIGISESSLKRGKKVMDFIDEHPDYKWFFENTLDQSINKSVKMTEKSPEFIEKVIEVVDGDKSKILPTIRELENEVVKQDITLPPGKYGVIIIDQTIYNSFNQFKNTDLHSICEEDSTLFIWVRPPDLELGIKELNKLGFSYRTCLVWNRYIKLVTSFIELAIVGTRGNPSLPFKFHKGSPEKPELFDDILEHCYPEISKVEIDTVGGWKNR